MNKDPKYWAKRYAALLLSQKSEYSDKVFPTLCSEACAERRKWIIELEAKTSEEFVDSVMDNIMDTIE